jgi:hypothetical protein
LPLRSIVPPRQSRISVPTLAAAASSIVSGGTTPSPLSFDWAKTMAVFIVSSTVTVVAAALPRPARMCFAEP